MYSMMIGLVIALFIAGIVIRLNVVWNSGRNRIRKGLLLTSHISSLIDNCQRHRGTSNAILQGNTKLAAQLESLQDKIDGSINNRMSLSLNHFPQWESFIEHWPRLKIHARDGDLKAYYLMRQHNLMIDGLLSLLDDVMRYHDLHKMMLDRQTRLSDICIDTLRVVETIGQTRAIGSGICAHGVCEGADKIIINFLRNSVQSSTEQLLAELHRIENANLSYGLKRSSDSIKSNVSALIDLIEKQVLIEGDVKLESSQYFSVSTKAIEDVLSVFGILTQHASKHHVKLL
jgi:hypothetical protein